MDPIWSQKSSVNRDFTVLTSVIVFIALLTSLWVTFEAYKQESGRIAKELEQESQRIHDGFEKEITQASYLLESIGRQVVQQNTSEPAEIARLLRAFDSNDELYTVFLWVDPELQAVTSSRQGVLDTPHDLTDRSYLHTARKRPFRVQIGAPTTGRITERLVLPLAIGLTDHSGRYIGNIALGIDLKRMMHNVRSYVHNPDISFTIVSDDIAPFSQAGSHERPLTEHKDFPALVQKMQKSRAFKDYLNMPEFFSGNNTFAFFQSTDQRHYTIITSYINDKSALKSLILPRLSQLLLVAAFLVSLLWLVRFRMIHPVQTLAAASREISRGNPITHVPQNGPMEIVQLSHNLQKTANYMAERKKVEEELITKVLGLKTAKETAEISDQAKVQILQLLRPEILPALEDIGEICSLLIDEEGEAPEAGEKEMLQEQLEHASIHLQEVVQEIFDLPSLSQSHQLANRTPIDVGALVHKCVMMLGDTLDREEVTVNIRLQEDMPKLSMNELHLMHIVMHLLVACASAIPAGGELTIEASMEESNRGPEFALIFNDNASGLDTQLISSLWRADSQGAVAHHQPSSKQSSYKNEENIGAVILTKKIISLHNGRMTVQNPPDKEALITVYFQQ